MLNGLKNFFKNLSQTAKITIFVGIFLVLAILVISIISLFRHQPTKTPPQYVNVSNFSESTNEIPDYYENMINDTVWSAISDKVTLREGEMLDAAIRDNSITNNGDGSFRAIVDIESLHYTFVVTMYFDEEPKPQASNNISIDCPTKDEVIYKDTKCPLGTPLEQLEQYLPLDLSTPDHLINVRLEANATGRAPVVYVNACGDQNLVAEGEKLFKKWLKDNYFDPNDFNISSSGICVSVSH
jgi:hypothetical protein